MCNALMKLVFTFVAVGIQDLAGLGQPALRVQDPALMSLDSRATGWASSS